MSKRPPNALEGKLHQAALAAPKQELTAKQAEALLPDATARQNALNFLLGGGLLKALKTESGSLIFRAVSKNELLATKDLSGEETLVLSHISGARNEGIWTKQLKAKTNLHQTIIDRCIKTLTQKKMIKRVQSVQHPTRKIFMLEHLEPSIALTGGPWYSDSELDTEFIKMLLTACLRFIQDKSYPKRRSSETDESAFYPISNAPKYPTAQSVRTFLKQSRITETDLTVEHVEMLLNVLILDGEIEKIPAFGATLWDSTAIADDASDGEDVDKPTRKKKRKRDDHNVSDNESLGKLKRKKRSSAEVSGDSDEGSSKKSKRSRSKSKKRARDASDDSNDADAKRKKKKREEDSDHSSSSTDSEVSRRRKHKKNKKKKKSRRQPSSDSETESSSASNSDSESDRERARRRRKGKLAEASPSPEMQLGALEEFAGSANVYRAIKQERLALGWAQAPCAECPSFEFCKPGGPVDPHECVYYGEWLSKPLGGISGTMEGADW